MSVYRYIFLFATAAITLSCVNYRSREIAIVIDEWIGKEFIIPQDLSFTSNGNSLSISDEDYDFFIVNYADSSNCTECSLKLPLWEHFMSRLDTSEVKVALLTVVGGDQSSLLYRLTGHHAYNYPVAIDKYRCLKRSNGSDFGKYFTTMLLDNKKRILAVGNPVLNTAVGQLYMNRMFEDNHFVKNNSTLIVDYPSRNVGFVNHGDTVYTSFLVNNISDSIYTISELITSCHCLTAHITSDTIYPRRSARIEIAVTYDNESDETDNNFSFERELQLICNEITSPLTLKINGYYKP